MRSLAAAVTTALAERAIKAYDLVWLTCHDRDDGSDLTFGFWAGAGTKSVSVIDGISGATVSRSFAGSGTLLSVGPVPLVSDLSVRTVTIGLNPFDATVEDALRGADPRLASVQIYRALFTPLTEAMVAAAVPRFVGVVDGVEIVTPAEGGDAAAQLTCVSRTRELTRTNPDVRSHESQQNRAAGDDFYKYTAVCSEWEIYWGRKQGRVKGKKGGSA